MGGRPDVVQGGPGGPTGLRTILNLPTALVVFIAIVLTVAVLLVTGLVPFPQRDFFDADPPFASVSEFPSGDETDHAVMMKLAAAFLESPKWSGEAASVEGWSLADIAALTPRGERIGVYADVRFQRELPVSGPLLFIRCGQNEIWDRSGGEFKISGLRIWLLDGESRPYNVLPLNQHAELPKLRDIEAFVTSPVVCAGPLGAS